MLIKKFFLNRYGPLLAQLKEMQKKLHNPPKWDQSEMIITSGSQDGLCKALEMMLMPQDNIVVQEPCYAGTLAIVMPHNYSCRD